MAVVEARSPERSPMLESDGRAYGPNPVMEVVVGTGAASAEVTIVVPHPASVKSAPLPALRRLPPRSGGHESSQPAALSCGRSSTWHTSSPMRQGLDPRG